jgi:hypothetical protein
MFQEFDEEMDSQSKLFGNKISYLFWELENLIFTSYITEVS